jgi:Leishmanolysin
LDALAQAMDKSFFRGNSYIDATGATIPADRITTNYLEGGRNVTAVVTPLVRAAARNHLGCSSLRGAELEDDGGAGTAGSHWEQRLFEGALCRSC